jgi:hypothetical protein
MTQDFEKALTGEQEVQISVKKKDGKGRTVPVWFSVEGRTLELMPMYGQKTKWFKVVESSGNLEIRAKDAVKSASPKIVRDRKTIDAIKRRFGAKYGEGQVSKYYPNQDVALEVQI